MKLRDKDGDRCHSAGNRCRRDHCSLPAIALQWRSACRPRAQPVPRRKARPPALRRQEMGLAWGVPSFFHPKACRKGTPRGRAIPHNWAKLTGPIQHRIVTKGPAKRDAVAGRVGPVSSPHDITAIREHLKTAIRSIPDYPKPGIIFRDITTLLGDARAFRRAVDELVQPWAGSKIDKVAGIEARGFILGGAVAHQVSAGFIHPQEGQAAAQARVHRLFARIRPGRDGDARGRGGERRPRLLVDDLIATGGTAGAAVKFLRQMGAEVLAACFVIDLPDLGGAEKSASSACPCARSFPSRGTPGAVTKMPLAHAPGRARSAPRALSRGGAAQLALRRGKAGRSLPSAVVHGPPAGSSARSSASSASTSSSSGASSCSCSAGASSDSGPGSMAAGHLHPARRRVCRSRDASRRCR